MVEDTLADQVVSGRAMDRPIKNTWRTSTKIIWIFLFLLLGATAIGLYLFYSVKRPIQVSLNDVTVSIVEDNYFADEVLTRASVEYVSSVRLNAGQGGSVEKVFVRTGDLVEKGDIIFKLSNPVFEREALARQVGIRQSLTDLATTRYNITLKTLEYKREILELDHEIARLKNRIEIFRDLVAHEAVSPLELSELETKLVLQRNLRDASVEIQRTEAKLVEQRLAGLEGNEAALKAELKLTNNLLRDLIIRAPISGQLSELSAEVGQNVTNGQMIGRIDDTKEKRLIAQIDEFYLARVSPGLNATAEFEGRELELSLERVFPEVNGGAFKVEFKPTTAKENFTKGQSLRVNLILGKPTKSLTIPDNGFVQSTGGNWVYLVDDNMVSTRKDIIIGRKNDHAVEIVNGLKAGDRIITSSYHTFERADRIMLTP